MCHNCRTCDQVMQQLFAYLDQEVDAATRANIERHLKACPSCLRRVEFEKRLRAKIRDAATQKAPDRLHRRIKELLERF